MSKAVHALEKAKEQQRIANAYKRVFAAANEDGQTILADFIKVFGMEMPAFLPREVAGGVRENITGFDPLHAAKRDGQQDILRHIRAKLSAPDTGDANITEPKNKIITS